MTCKRCHRKSKYRGLCQLHFEVVGHHGFVDAQPTKDRIALLRARGYSLRGLAERTGVTMPTLLCRYDKVQATTERAVMGVPVPTAVQSMSGWVPAAGTRRRVQALAAIGWPQRVIAERCGIDSRHLNRVLRQESVTARTAAAVQSMFDQLWDQPGPNKRVLNDAIRKGWLPPLAWDDETIDDPDTTPHVDTYVPVTFTERYVEMREMGERSEEAIAKRLGIATQSVRDQCHRNKLERVS